MGNYNFEFHRKGFDNFEYSHRLLFDNMVGVAQLVRAPDCGSGGWRFNSARPP